MGEGRQSIPASRMAQEMCKNAKNASVLRTLISFLFLSLTWASEPVQATSSHGGYGVPRIIEHPESLVVAKGDPATLNCKALGNPYPKITWFRDGVEVTTSSQDPHNHRVIFPSGSLFFLSIKQGKKESDAGVYTCVATNFNGRATSRNATLTIAVLREEFRVAPSDVTATSGERAQLMCSPPRGHPPPELTWSRNGHEIDPEEEPERVQILEDGTLVIKEVLQTDEGEYVCHASNPAGRRSSPPAILDVIVAPFWVKAPRDVVGVAGGEAELSCRVGGDPPPAVTWRRVGGHIPVARMRMVMDRGLRVSHLRPQDAGVYVCNAANRAATISANASLTIYSAPKVSEVPGDVEVEEGAPLHLSCAVEGYPTPLVYWTREGSQKVLPVTRTPLEPTEGQEEEEEGIEGVRISYSVPRVAHYHSGRYVCGGVNSAGGVMTRVGVRVRPTPLLPPPIISVPPSNQTLPARGHAGLTCRVWGSPEPKVTWRHRGKVITSTKRREILPDNTLSISELVEDDGGEYVCVASSPRGVTEARATLVVTPPSNLEVVFVRAPDPDTAPGPPDTPTVTSVNASAATLLWDIPSRQGASPVTGYSVEYYSSMEGSWKVATAHIARTTYTLSPIDRAVRYGVTVRAHNSHGVSEPSGIAEVSGSMGWEKSGEEEASVREAKVILQEAVFSGAASAKLLWQMSGESNTVEGFYIRLHHVSRDQHQPSHLVSSEGEKNKVKETDIQAETKLENFTVVTVVNAGRGASSYVLHGLHHYRSYTVFLVPFFKMYEGHPSNSRSFLTPEAAPSASPQGVSVQLTNVTTASLFWSPPPPLHRNGIITDYQIDMVTSSGEVFLSKTVNGTVTSLRVHNLTLGNSYHLTLAASTSAGRGPFTPPISLHVDPVLLHPLAKSGTSLASLDGEVWVIGMIGGAVFCVLLGCVATLLIWRRHARNKALSHVAVSVQKVDNLGFGLVSGDSGLWQDYAGWQLEKLCANSDSAMGGTSGTRTTTENDVKVMNTSESVVECDNAAPRSLVTFYRGPTTTEGPYATTALLGPHSLPHQPVKSPKDAHRASDGGASEQLSLGHPKNQSDRYFIQTGRKLYDA
ncbi:roundabout homolog 2-like [Macrobrachium nipponense]|uniref:roundabout homolog 2-like n=1 Tax=Macrobrachium nipponense TaxID=159736 RepID=UPI0030C7B5FC